MRMKIGLIQKYTPLNIFKYINYDFLNIIYLIYYIIMTYNI